MKTKKLHFLAFVVAWIFLVISIGCSKSPDLLGTITDVPPPPPPPPPPSGVNKVPIADAGADQTITAPQDWVMLDGSLSKDPDGDSLTFVWTKVTGSDLVEINQNPKGTKAFTYVFEPGVYGFELQVKDNNGAISKDTTNVTVLPDSLTRDTSVITRFNSLSFGNNCKIIFYDTSWATPAANSMQVFIRDYGINPWHYGHSGGWVKVDAIRSSSYWYEIQNNNLIIHAAAGTLCGFQDYLFYEVLIKWK